MIMPISQININKTHYLIAKNNRVSFRQEEKIKENILDEDTTQSGDDIKAMRRLYNSLLLILSSIVLIMSVMAAKGSFSLKNIFKNSFDEKFGFKSLKSDKKIPTLVNCKSINKDLKNILEEQIFLNKNNSIIKSEFNDESLINNRFLLFGKPGTGKSYFSKIFAKSIDAEYAEVLFSDLNSRWVGDVEDALKRIFETSLNLGKKNPDKKYVLTLNEIDAFIVPPDNLSHSQGSHWVSILRQRSIFLNYLEILKEKAPNVIVIGTTNISPRNNGLDNASLSRFQNLIEVPYPDSECIYEALKSNLENLKMKDEFYAENEENLRKLAEKMSKRKFSFRNLDRVVEHAKIAHIVEKTKTRDSKFRFEYLEKAEKSITLSDGELS